MGAAGAVLSVVAAGVAGAAVNQTTNPIQHVVVIMEENHTFDNYFGQFPGVGAQYAQTLPAASNPAPHDIDHSGPRTGTRSTAAPWTASTRSATSSTSRPTSPSTGHTRSTTGWARTSIPTPPPAARRTTSR